MRRAKLGLLFLVLVSMVALADLTPIGVHATVIGQATATAPPVATVPPTPPSPATPTSALTQPPTSTPEPADTSEPTVTPQARPTLDPEAPATEFRRLGQLGGQSRAMAIIGQHALLGIGSRLEVLDVADGEAPAKIAHYMVPGIVTAIAVDEARTVAFVLETRGRLHVLDISQIDRPRVAAVLDLPPACCGALDRLVLYRDFAYLAAEGGLAVVDATEPEAPIWVGRVPAAGSATDLTVAGDRLYIASQRALQVFDLTSPEEPRLLGSADVLPELGERMGSVTGVAVAADTAYVAAFGYGDWSDVSDHQQQAADSRLVAEYRPFTHQSAARPAAPINTECYVLAFDVSDPAAPAEAGRFDATGTIEFPGRLAVAGARLFMEGSQYAGPVVTYGSIGVLLAFDIEEPQEPRYFGRFDPHHDYGSDVVAARARLYVPEWHGGLRTLDTSMSVTPTLLSTYDFPFVPRAIAASAGQVVVGDHGIGGVWSIDAGQPEDASVLGSVEISGGACGADCEVVVRDDLAYMADQNDGLVVIDVGDPGEPRVLSMLPEVGDGHAIALNGGIAYIGATTWQDDATHQVVVVDVGDPLAPRMVGRVRVGGEVSGLAYSDGVVYAATSAGLAVVRVEPPGSPAVVGSLAVGGAYSRLAASGFTVYVVEVNGTLHVIDASDPEHPQQVGWMDKAREDDVRPNSAQAIQVTGTTVYVMHLQWLQAVDVSDPRAPREAGWILAYDLGTEGGLIAMALKPARVGGASHVGWAGSLGGVGGLSSGYHGHGHDGQGDGIASGADTVDSGSNDGSANDNGLGDRGLGTDGPVDGGPSDDVHDPGDLLYLASAENGVVVVEAIGSGETVPRECERCRVWLPALATGDALAGR
ncbi:MAG: LVIVD repeat-containing protein [Anaerolineae bacterium]